MDPDGTVFSHRFYRAMLLSDPEPGGRMLLGLGGNGMTSSLVFTNQTTSGGQQALIAVDPSAPDDWRIIEPAGRHSSETVNFVHQNSVLEATVDPQTGLHAHSRIRFSVYARENRIWKFDHESGADGTLLSALSTAELCSTAYSVRRVVHDYADASRSWAFFTTPGPSRSCFPFPDDLRHLGVRMDMGPDDPPRPVPLPLTPIYATSGSIAGFVVQDQEKIQRVDADFANPKTLFTVPNPPLVINGVTNYTVYTRGFLFGQSAPGRWLYLAVHEFQNEFLMGYDLSAEEGPVPIVRLPSTSSSSPNGTVFSDWTDTDGTNVFIALNEHPNRSVIARIGEDFTLQRLATNAAAVHELSLTDGHVVIRNDKRIWSVPKSGGEPRLLVSLANNQELVPKFRVRRAARTVEHNTVRIRMLVTAGENVWFEATFSEHFNVPRHDVHVVSAADPEPVVETFESASIVTWAAPPEMPWCVDTSAHAIYIVDHREPTLTDVRHDIAGMPFHARDGRTREYLFEMGRMPTANLTVGSVSDSVPISYGTVMGEPLQYGEPGLIPIYGRPIVDGKVTGPDLVLFHSDMPGLIPVTRFGID